MASFSTFSCVCETDRRIRLTMSATGLRDVSLACGFRTRTTGYSYIVSPLLTKQTSSVSSSDKADIVSIQF